MSAGHGLGLIGDIKEAGPKMPLMLPQLRFGPADCNRGCFRPGVQIDRLEDFAAALEELTRLALGGLADSFPRVDIL